MLQVIIIVIIDQQIIILHYIMLHFFDQLNNYLVYKNSENANQSLA